MIAIKRKVIEELLKDPKWSKRLEEAKTMEEVLEVFRMFAEEKKLKVKTV